MFFTFFLTFTESSTEVVPLYQSKAVVDTIGVLPCNTTAISASHPPILVIWYKNGGGDPVYRWEILKKINICLPILLNVHTYICI